MKILGLLTFHRVPPKAVTWNRLLCSCSAVNVKNAVLYIKQLVALCFAISTESIDAYDPYPCTDITLLLDQVNTLQAAQEPLLPQMLQQQAQQQLQIQQVQVQQLVQQQMQQQIQQLVQQLVQQQVQIGIPQYAIYVQPLPYLLSNQQLQQLVQHIMQLQDVRQHIQEVVQLLVQQIQNLVE